MARSKNPTPEILPDTLDQTALQTANEASQVLSAASVEAADTADLYRFVGRMETAHFMETVSAKVIAQTYVQARDHIGKLGELNVRNQAGEWKRVSGMDAFCEFAMPVSARRCRQIVAAIETLGDGLFEQAERIGFGARDYSALRALPEDDQAVVKQALASGDRDDVLALLTELAARNATLKRDAAAKDKVIAKKDTKLNQLMEAEERRRTGTMPEREKAQCDDLRDAGTECEHALLRLVATVDGTLREPATEAAELQARQTLEYVVQRLADACAQAGIGVDVLGELVEPGWLRPTKEAATRSRTPKHGE